MFFIAKLSIIIPEITLIIVVSGHTVKNLILIHHFMKDSYIFFVFFILYSSTFISSFPPYISTISWLWWKNNW